MSFAKINIINTRFIETNIGNPDEEVLSRSVTGAFLYVSLGADVTVRNCNFE